MAGREIVTGLSAAPAGTFCDSGPDAVVNVGAGFPGYCLGAGLFISWSRLEM